MKVYLRRKDEIAHCTIELTFNLHKTRRKFDLRRKGIEPLTYCLEGSCSIR